MGEVTLLEHEAQPVMARLASRGIAVTASHNHLLGIKPPLVYVH